jgi:beta-phosphoglucomutase family hydrolase
MDIRAYILDLDGVITHTAKLHVKAWKRLFDEYNESRRLNGQETYRPFDAEDDYRMHLDGKPRQDGIKSFLDSRGIQLKPEMLFNLGNRKNEFFQLELQKTGPTVFPDAIEALRTWREQGFSTAVASSSKNCEQILNVTNIADLFDVRVDGVLMQKWKLPGKPAPDIFLTAAHLLDVLPSHAAVLEDAISGIQAARAGHFGLVVGVARFGQAEHLEKAGPDLIISSLTDLIATPMKKAA